MEPVVGIEPTTYGLRTRKAATESQQKRPFRRFATNLPVLAECKAKKNMEALAKTVGPETSPQPPLARMPRRPRRLVPLRIVRFTNPDGGKVWRVTGWSGVNGKRQRIRRNFPTEAGALAYKLEIETNALQGDSVRETLRPTILSMKQLAEAESAWQVLMAAGHTDGALVRAAALLHRDHPEAPTASVRVDEAVTEFRRWLSTPEVRLKLRPRSIENLRARVGRLSLFLGRHLVNEITPERLEGWFNELKLEPRSQQNYRLVASRFFAWCAERPRRWCLTNPAKEVKIVLPRAKEPVVLNPEQCEKLLRAAQAHRGGIAVPYLAIGLFGGLRRAEIERLNPDQINLDDREIRVAASQSKTERSRVVEINDTLLAWLRWCEARKLTRLRVRKEDIETVRRAAGFLEWPDNALRHTAISVRARMTGSFVETAVWAGNSEPVIRRHYWGNMSSKNAAMIMSIKP